MGRPMTKSEQIELLRNTLEQLIKHSEDFADDPDLNMARYGLEAAISVAREVLADGDEADAVQK